MKVIFEEDKEDVIKFIDIDVSSNYIVGMSGIRNIFVVSRDGKCVDSFIGAVIKDQFDETFAKGCKKLQVFKSYQEIEATKYLASLLLEDLE